MQFVPSSNHYPSDQLVRVGSIVDGEALLTHNNRDRFQATSLRVIFRPKDGSWYCNHAEVSGGILKKDGTPGKLTGSRSFILDDPETPEWVKKIVRHLQPTVPAPSVQLTPLALD